MDATLNLKTEVLQALLQGGTDPNAMYQIPGSLHPRSLLDTAFLGEEGSDEQCRGKMVKHLIVSAWIA